MTTRALRFLRRRLLELLLDRGFVYEGEIERFSGAWPTSITASSTVGRTSDSGRSWLRAARSAAARSSRSKRPRTTRRGFPATPSSNGGRFKVLRRAIGSTTGNQVWLSGIEGTRPSASAMLTALNWAKVLTMISLDSLSTGSGVGRSSACHQARCRGMEVDAVKAPAVAGKRNRHHPRGSWPDRAHTVSRYLLIGRPRLFGIRPATSDMSA